MKNSLSVVTGLLLALSLLSSRLAWAAGEFAQIPEESLSNWGDSINPNEGRFYVFQPVNDKKTGALISVGTFRALAAASQGEFSHIFLLDADSRVVEFNRLQIDALKKSATVGEFLAVLSPSHSSYVNSLVLLASDDPGTTFLKNRLAYNKLRKLALDDRIYAIGGDLAGDKTLAELSRALKTQKVNVSVLDVSNAADYILMQKKAPAYLRNLRSLPFVENAAVNFTAERSSYSMKFGQKYGAIREKGYGWLYFSVPAVEYVEAVGRFKDSSGPYHEGEYAQFIDSLFETPADLNAPFRISCSMLFN